MPNPLPTDYARLIVRSAKGVKLHHYILCVYVHVRVLWIPIQAWYYHMTSTGSHLLLLFP